MSRWQRYSGNRLAVVEALSHRCSRYGRQVYAASAMSGAGNHSGEKRAPCIVAMGGGPHDGMLAWGMVSASGMGTGAHRWDEAHYGRITRAEEVPGSGAGTGGGLTSATADPGSGRPHRRQLSAATPGGICRPIRPVGRRDVWERLDQEFLFYIGRPGQIMLWLKRMGQFMPLIEQRLKEYGLPDDLKYLAVVESSLRPTAVSSAGAGGLWQFIEGTGRRFDLDSNALVDDRTDVSKAT